MSGHYVIDAHSHAGDFTGFITGNHSPLDLVEAWDEAGVDAGMIAILNPRDPHGANDAARRACQDHAGRMFAYVYLNPTDVAGSLAEIAHCRTHDCFRGVKLHPSNDTYYPFFEGYFPIYQRIEEAGLPILWHSGTSPYSHPLQIAYTARLFPSVPFILAHFGLSDLTWECFPAAELAENVYVDTTANPIVPVMNDWLDRFGARRMLWGSDFPFYDVRYELLKLEYLKCDSKDRRLISGENARRLFRL